MRKINNREAKVLIACIDENVWTVNYTKLSRELNMPVSTVFDITRRLKLIKPPVKVMRKKIQTIMDMLVIDNFLRQ